MTTMNQIASLNNDEMIKKHNIYELKEYAKSA